MAAILPEKNLSRSRGIIATAIVLFMAAAAWAQSPSDLRELIAEMNFEQAALAGQTLPRGWDQTQLTGDDIPETARFPHYLSGMVTNEFSTAGNYSFMLSLNGGNLAYSYTDTIEASGEYDYMITGMLRTELLQNARAQVRMQLVDVRGNPIDGALTVSKPLGGPHSKYYRKWSPFTLRLNGRYNDAYSLRLTLALLQKQVWQYPAPIALDHQDIRAACWFDDIKVYRLPRISLRTSSVTNTFMPWSQKSLIASTEGLPTSTQAMALSIYNSDWSVVMRRVLDKTTANKNGLINIDIPPLDPGLYQAQLHISAANSGVLTRKIEFAIMPTIPTGDNRGIIIDATAVEPAMWKNMAEMAKDIEAYGVMISPWQSDNQGLQQAIEHFNSQGLSVTMVWGRLPQSAPLDGGGRHGDLLRVLSDGDQWLSDSFQLLLSEHAASVNAWQLGACGDNSLPWSEYLPQAYSIGNDWVKSLVADRKLLLSWDASVAYDLPEETTPLTLSIDNGIQPWLIPEQVAEFEDQASRIYLPIDPHMLVSPQLQDDFALRYAYCRAAGIKSVVVPPLWDHSDDGLIVPDPLMLTIRTLSGWIGDASFLGTARLDDRRTAIMFRRSDGQGVIVIHALRDASAMGPVAMELPATARAVDMSGNSIPLTTFDDKAQLPPWTGVYLITGCDADTLAIRSSMKFTPDSIDNIYENQEVKFSMTNPFPSPMVGEVSFDAPVGWAISPQRFRFSIDPGSDWQLPLSIRFPFAAMTDLHRIETKVQVYRGREMQVSAPMLLRILPKDVELGTYIALRDDGLLEVQISVTNNGDTPVDLNCFVKAKNRPQQNQVVNNLKPDSRVFKLFIINRGKELVGTDLITGMREIEGPRIINQSTPIQ